MSLPETMHRFEVRGTIIREWVVPAKGFVAFYVNRGDVLRFVDLEGKQCPDVVFFNRSNLQEHLNNGTVSRLLRTAGSDW